jgi:hypothetical protein
MAQDALALPPARWTSTRSAQQAVCTQRPARYGTALTPTPTRYARALTRQRQAQEPPLLRGLALTLQPVRRWRMPNARQGAIPRVQLPGQR